MNPLRIGICGLGTVGSGTFNVLKRNAAQISARAGRPVEVVLVASRRPNPACDLGDVRFTTDLFEVATDPQIDVVVELIGGYDLARELVLKAIDCGKHVVTANKALIAVHGNEIFKAAAEKGVSIGFEASVAGGIPVIKALREGLAANQIRWLAGIINGTSNYILTEMRDKGREFADVLKEAQALGYAEADPTFDVEGIDAAHKLTILASVAFGIPLQFERVFTEGISSLSPVDVAYAEELGYRIKHLGIARRLERGIELRVHPTLVPESQLIAKVDGVMNAILVEGDAVGQALFHGRGAGSEPTASAVVADIIDVARALREGTRVPVPFLGVRQECLDSHPILAVEEVQSAYYLRILAEDRPGVLAKVAAILSEQGINIESIMQKESELHEGMIPMILLTHRVQERSINQAIAAIEALPTVAGKVVRLRVEQLR